MKYYSVLKKNKMAKFAEKWIDFEYIILRSPDLIEKKSTCSPSYADPNL